MKKESRRMKKEKKIFPSRKIFLEKEKFLLLKGKWDGKEIISFFVFRHS
ncbi:MAG: hypothetical protein IK000_03025 [Bacteroidaceae bacterium]|nr:hypothetical protein [Bacteroidaceae bacterium]